LIRQSQRRRSQRQTVERKVTPRGKNDPLLGPKLKLEWANATSTISSALSGI